MRFAAAVAAASVAGLATASVQYDAPKNGTAPAYVTEVVTAYTTYCPEATEITHAGETYTVSEATTLTITNCPGGCTVVKPATSSVVSVCVDCSTSAPAVPETTESSVISSETPVAPVPASSSPVAPVEETPAVPVAPAPYPSSNGTTPIAAPAPSGTGAPTESTTGAAPFEGAASSLTATGAGILAIFGLVAFL